MTTAKRYLHALIVGIVGIVAFIVFLAIGRPYSGFPVILIDVAIGLGGWYLLDKYFFKGVDTIEAIKKNNISFAIMFLGYAIIIAAAISSN